MATTPEQQADEQLRAIEGEVGGQPPAGSTPARFSRDEYIGTSPLESNTASSTEKILRYPATVGNDAEHLHWVVFYPLARKGQKSKYITSNKYADAGSNQINESRKAENATNVAGNIVGVMTGAAAGASIASKLLSGGGKANGSPAENIASGIVNGFGKLAGAAGGALVGFAGSEVVTAAYQAVAGNLADVYFAETAVALHVSEKISSSYAANWDIAELGGLIATVGSGATNIAGAITSEGGADYIMRKMGKISSIVGGDLLNNTIEASTKKVENPYKQQLFKSMGFRKFTFDYKFSPRNEAEARTIFGDGSDSDDYQARGILYTFLRHMHPEKTSSNMFLEYPSEFLIVYYYQDRENPMVRKISNCALTNMSIDYGAEGMTSFADGSGMPTECTIRLEFTELETLTGDRIQKGY